MTDFYSQNRCVCSTRSHGPMLCAFCLSFHFKEHCEKRVSASVVVIDHRLVAERLRWLYIRWRARYSVYVYVLAT